MQYSQSFTFIHLFLQKVKYLPFVHSHSFLSYIKKREINYFFQQPIVSRGNKIMISLLSHINFSEK